MGPLAGASHPLSVHPRFTNRSIRLQVRGPKKHLKRLNAPKHWMLDKMGGTFVRGAYFGMLDARITNLCI